MNELLVPKFVLTITFAEKSLFESSTNIPLLLFFDISIDLKKYYRNVSDDYQ